MSCGARWFRFEQEIVGTDLRSLDHRGLALPSCAKCNGIDVFAQESPAEEREIAFSAGSHRELIRLPWKDFEKLTKRQMTMFAAGGTAEAA
jgi:hypothetical protein